LNPQDPAGLAVIYNQPFAFASYLCLRHEII
jgi:hypothetical protein